MSSVFSLLEGASKRLQTNDAVYHEQANTTLAILRASGVLPIKRSCVNGELHKLIAGMIVSAYDASTTIDVATRHAGSFAYYGYSTQVISYLDKAIQQNLLSSNTGKAKGQLVIGDLLETYLAA